MKTIHYWLLISALFTLVGCSETPAEAKSFNDMNQNGTLETYEDTSLSPAVRAADLLSRLSIEQKIKLVNGTGMSMAGDGSQKVPGAAGSTYALPDFGIPAVVLSDGPAGVRIKPTRDNDPNTYYATAFPIATAIASSWNTELAEQIGAAMGDEVKEYGIDVFLAPALNIQLNPRGGRNFEYYSEDPFISGMIAASVVNGVESNGVGATIKHFVANQVETSRMVLNAEVDEQAMREIYLKGFEIAVKQSQPWAVMSSYNKLNGTYTSQSKALLSDILRDEWGFTGVVMTDWFAGDDSAAQMQAGNDLIMPGTPANHRQISEALLDGSLSEAELDRNITRIIAMIFKTPAMQQYAYSDKPDLTAHAQIARQAAAEGVVLLRNNDATLPLKGLTRVATFGNTSYNFIAGGTGSGDVNEAYTVSLVDALEANGFKINSQLQKTYEQYAQKEKAKQPEKTSFFQFIPPIAEMPVSETYAQQLAKQEDIAVITLGRNSGEFQDRKVAGDFYLTDTELSLIATVADAFHAEDKKVVVILNIGNTIETASWKDKVDAIVLPWQGGQEAGNAVVDVLTGSVNPSGHLAVTFPMTYEQIPSANTFPGKIVDPEVIQNPYLNALPNGQRSVIAYQEGIYVGYRFFDSFKQEVSYPFGYGLSYANFALSDLNLSQNGSEYQVSVTVKNTSQVAGKEVVQLYVSAPEGKLTKAAQTLQGFAKTRLLAPNETQTLTIAMDTLQLASFDANRHQWIAEAGDYHIKIGRSSRNIVWQDTITLPDELTLSTTLTPLPTSIPVKTLKH
ncbi:MAG: glycoside hydrolase family 3 C-terminal domain-containing protein [Alteromonadaceae bacterium]|nr:glycoside hydrolase family 3 C-terminal domain-containing protein [Alteromonadaceae bacterium]